MDEKVYTIKVAAQKINYSERHLRQLCIDGKIPGAYKIPDGRKWLIPSQCIEALEKKLGVKNKPTEVRIKADQYEETLHKKTMRDMATALATALSLPLDFHSFIDELTPGDWIIGRGFFIRITEARKVEPVLVLGDEGLQAPQVRMHLYEALLAHLKTGGFPEVEGYIADWKRESGKFLLQSHELFKMIMKDVGDRHGLVFSFDSLEQGGFTPDYFKSLFQTVIFGLEPESHLYRRKASDLWCGAYKIYIAAPGEDQESYKRTHMELREKYLRVRLAKQIGEQWRTVKNIERAVRKRLTIFADMERLRGQCALC